MALLRKYLQYKKTRLKKTGIGLLGGFSTIFFHPADESLCLCHMPV